MRIEEVCRTLIPGYNPFADPGDCWFDAAAAEHATGFFPDCLRHVEGAIAGQPFMLEPWQQAVIGNLFGWKRRDARGRTIRRYRECLLYVPRKNGKTPLIAGLAAYVFFCEDEAGQQDYVAAADREQAGMLFRHLKGMVERNPRLAKRCRIYGGNAAGGQSRSLVREADGSFVRVVSADADTKHGGNPHLIVIDELHAQPDAELYDVLHTGMASENRAQPLFVSLTTADFDRPSVCNERHEYACRVRDGLIADPSFLPVIHEAKSDTDWRLPATWRACNPNLGVSVSLEYLRSECEKAQQIPRLENTFKRLHLNMRTAADQRWLSLEAWDAGDGLLDEADLAGQPCWCGLDLSATTDITALALVFRGEGRSYRALFRYWVPAENLHDREKRDRVPYDTWVRQGWITATPGRSVDYDCIRAEINDLNARFAIREIAADRWNATQLIGQLEGDGLCIFPFGQGYRDMSPAAKELERAMLEGELCCGRNPVTRWMAGNAAVEEDAAGNIKPSKKKSTQRIDGIVALSMGLARASIEGAGFTSCYETMEGLRAL